MDQKLCMEKAKALRADPEIHYSCAQSTLLSLRPENGLDDEQCMNVAHCFEAGMRCGAVCGAVTGSLMALGLHGVKGKVGQEFVRRFRAKEGAINCAELLKMAVEQGEERKPHCDRMVFDAVELATELLAEQEQQ